MTEEYVKWLITIGPLALLQVVTLIAVIVIGVVEFFLWRGRRSRRRRAMRPVAADEQPVTASRLVSLREILWRKPVPHGMFGDPKAWAQLDEEPYSMRSLRDTPLD